MVSEKQLRANTQNALLGGVKTPNGKAISRFNALKHGLLSEQALLENEDEGELRDLGERLRRDLKPASEMEMVLVERIIVNTRRLKRVIKAEVEMIEHDTEMEKDFGAAFSYDSANNYNSYDKFTRYETSIERGLYKALHELQRLQGIRTGAKTALPIAIDLDMSKDE